MKMKYKIIILICILKATNCCILEKASAIEYQLVLEDSVAGLNTTGVISGEDYSFTEPGKYIH